MDLYFSSSSYVSPGPWRPGVHVWPVDKGWNDFGYGFQASACIVAEGREPLNLRLFVVPWDGQLLNRRFNLWIQNDLNVSEDRFVNIEPEKRKFLSILRSHGYQEIYDWSEGDSSLWFDALTAINDIVLMGIQPGHESQISAFISDESVRLGVFRDESAYSNFRIAWRILVGSKKFRVIDARRNFDFKCKLLGYGGPHDASFRFNSPPPLHDRCQVLIGRNGVGKSRFLRQLIASMGKSRGVDSSLLLDEDSTASFGPGEDCLSVSRIILLAWGDSIGYANELPLDASMEYVFCPVIASGSGVFEKSRDNLLSMLVQVLRDPVVDGRIDRLAVLRNVLSPHLPIDLLSVRVQGGEWISVGSLLMSREQAKLDRLGRIDPDSEIRIWSGEGAVPLSSGQYSIVSFSVRIVCSLLTGSLVILDEPETHLHPNMIAEMMHSLQELLSASNSIAIIATHSPFIVREVPTDCVHVIRLDDSNVPTFRRSYLRTLGASVDSLANDIFQDAESNTHHQEIAKEISRRCQTIEQAIAQYGTHISAELLADVRAIMDGEDDIS